MAYTINSTQFNSLLSTEPNYIAYVSGSTNSCTNDNNIDIDAKSIADSLEAKGVSWGAYAEGEKRKLSFLYVFAFSTASADSR